MFKRSKKEPAPQVGPDKEQFSGTTPVGDALEQEIKHPLRWEELTHQADLQESQAVVADPELLEQRRQTASTHQHLARELRHDLFLLLNPMRALSQMENPRASGNPFCLKYSFRPPYVKLPVKPQTLESATRIRRHGKLSFPKQ